MLSPRRKLGLLGTVSRRLRGEEGFTMIIAITILFIGMLLTGAAVMAATQTSGSAQNDTNRKNALEAAEAGLNAALYRLNELNPANSSCTTDASSTTVTDSGGQLWCQSNSYSLGNGSSYQYWVTPVLSSGTCVGLSISNSSTTVNQRCITSVGTSNGITERSQVRTAAFNTASSPYTSAVVGYNGITLSGSAMINGVGSTNKTLTASGGAHVTTCDDGPAATYNPTNASFCGTKKTETTAFTPTTVSAGTSNNMTSGACPSRYSASSNPSSYCNDDFRIVNALAHTTPADTASGNVSFTSSTRTLNLSGGASLTLNGSLYNFCSLVLSGGSTLAVSQTQQVTVIIDSTADGCPSGGNNASHVDFSGGSVSNPKADPAFFQLEVVGTGTVTLSGSSASYGLVQAPQSAINFSGSAAWLGSVIGDTVTMSGGAFTYANGSYQVSNTSSGAFFRTGWAQCTASYSASNPGANCG